ncbi:hypothetical protein FOZ63_016819, partial [Perkinsus olseni]
TGTLAVLEVLVYRTPLMLYLLTWPYYRKTVTLLRSYKLHIETVAVCGKMRKPTPRGAHQRMDTIAPLPLNTKPPSPKLNNNKKGPQTLMKSDSDDDADTGESERASIYKEPEGEVYKSEEKFPATPEFDEKRFAG